MVRRSVVLLSALLLALGAGGCGSKHDKHRRHASSTSAHQADKDADELAASLESLSTVTATTPPPKPLTVASSYAARYAEVVKTTNALVPDFDSAQSAGDVDTARAQAAKLRDAIYAWDADVRAMDFPDSAKTDVSALLEEDRASIAELDALGAAGDDEALSQETADGVRDSFDAVTKAAVRLGGDLGLSTS